ncbi:MAG TPA: response regulator transcription factor [Solirubrobacteraceae bacterium]|nr:response regulator transcription factor [Solirubrobacteraceae bacterium]
MLAARTHPDPQRAAAAATGAPLRVLVADDHPLFRRGIARAIERHPGLELVAEATDGHDALELIHALKPDVAVLDVRMPRLTGIEVCAALQGDPGAPRTALLMLSAFDDGALVWDAVSAGAAGYLGKDASQAEVCRAIEDVGRGGSAL